MKVELLVIADQHAAVNTFPGLVHTARQAMEAGSTRSRLPNRVLKNTIVTDVSCHFLVWFMVF